MIILFARLSSIYNSLALRPIDIHVIITSACQVLSIHVGCVLQLQAEWQIHIESLLDLPVHATAIVMPFSVHSTITNMLINQAESHSNYYLIWDRSQLYPVTQIISLLLHLILTLPQSHVITTISSL